MPSHLAGMRLIGGAFILSWLAAVGIAWTQLISVQQSSLAQNLAYLSPFWIPVVAAAYFLGRRRITAPTLIAFWFVETAALIVMLWLPWAYR
jgi:hypothetical protein